MTITRTIDGVEHTFTLSDRELCDAYFEQQYKFDKYDILDELEALGGSYLKEEYGYGLEQAKTYAEDMAAELRRNLDKYGIDFDYAKDEAIRTVLHRAAR